MEAYDLTGDKALLDAAARIVDHLAAQLQRLGVPLANTGYFSGLPSMSILKPVVMLAEHTGAEDWRGVSCGFRAGRRDRPRAGG